MRIFHSCVVSLFLMVLLMTLLGGCGNSGGETTPAPALTGDTTLFPHKELLTTPTPEYVIPEQTIVLDARPITQTIYNEGHIPGAIYASPRLFQDANEKLLSKELLAEKLGGMGITRDSKILIYDNTTASEGAGGRLFWILEYLGCTNVTMLNGGYDFWQSQDLPVEKGDVIPNPTVFSAGVSDLMEYSTADVKRDFFTAPKNGLILIDVREIDEYEGTRLYMASREGHIRGAKNLPYSEFFIQGQILGYDKLKDKLALRGITLAENPTIVAYSTIGHRSSFFYFMCRLMGYSNVINYTDSIVDWAKAEPKDEYPMDTGRD